MKNLVLGARNNLDASVHDPKSLLARMSLQPQQHRRLSFNLQEAILFEVVKV